MESISLKRAVTLIVIVTEGFKEQLRAEVQTAIDDVDQNVQQMESQSRRYLLELQRTNLQQAMQLRQRVDEERQKQTAVRQELERQLGEIDSLEIGEEFRRGAMEGQVDVKPGDNLIQVLNAAELVIKDGLVQEIRYAELPAEIEDAAPAPAPQRAPAPQQSQIVLG